MTMIPEGPDRGVAAHLAPSPPCSASRLRRRAALPLVLSGDGYGGLRSAPSGPRPVLDRTVRIRFEGNVNSALPWSFAPVQQAHGRQDREQALAYFKAINNVSTPITGTRSSMWRPSSGAAYFTKIECFCFKQQTLAPGETVEMPVTFSSIPRSSTTRTPRTSPKSPCPIPSHCSDTQPGAAAAPGKREVGFSVVSNKAIFRRRAWKRGETNGRQLWPKRTPSNTTTISSIQAHGRSSARRRASLPSARFTLFISKKAGTPQLYYVLPGLMSSSPPCSAGGRRDQGGEEGYETRVVQLHLRYGIPCSSPRR